MTADVRQQLTEALDEVERLAKSAGGPVDGGSWHVRRVQLMNGPYVLLAERQTEALGSRALAHIARWDPATVLRLVERDRQVLQRHQREGGAWKGDQPACSHCKFWWPCPDIKDAAAFWLGTPEGS